MERVILSLALFLFLASHTYAAPSGSCWSISPSNITYDSGKNNVFYQVKSLRLCFINDTYHNITVQMYATANTGEKDAPAASPWLMGRLGKIFGASSPRAVLLSPVTFTGIYLFEAPQSIVFSYSNDAACSEQQPYCCDLCPGVMYRFAGKYGFEVTPSFDAPVILSITPDSVPRAAAGDQVPRPYQWGDLDFSLPLSCDTVSCGSFVGVVPNPYQGGSVAYTVRRFQFSEAELINSAERQCYKQFHSWRGHCCGR